MIDASAPKRLELRVEVPVEDMARLDDLRYSPQRTRVARAGAQLDMECHPPKTGGTGS